jgi:hypothetical protein
MSIATSIHLDHTSDYEVLHRTALIDRFIEQLPAIAISHILIAAESRQDHPAFVAVGDRLRFSDITRSLFSAVRLGDNGRFDNEYLTFDELVNHRYSSLSFFNHDQTRATLRSHFADPSNLVLYLYVQFNQVELEVQRVEWTAHLVRPISTYPITLFDFEKLVTLHHGWSANRGDLSSDHYLTSSVLFFSRRLDTIPRYDQDEDDILVTDVPIAQTLEQTIFY